jgi:hypothetical protein
LRHAAVGSVKRCGAGVNHGPCLSGNSPCVTVAFRVTTTRPRIIRR